MSIYQDLAMRTNDGLSTLKVEKKLEDYRLATINGDTGELLNGALGITGEAGEVADMIKKYIFHGHDLDRDAFIKELGDVCWYVALLSHAIGIDLGEVMDRNIEKLARRYPEGFTNEASIKEGGIMRELQDRKIMVVYKDGTHNLFTKVTNYGFYQQSRIFWLRVDGQESYFPAENVKFFGDFIDYPRPENA